MSSPFWSQDYKYIVAISAAVTLIFIIIFHRSQYTDITNELNKYNSINAASFKYKSENGVHKINEIQFMDGMEFEQFCGNLFILLGYKIDYTPPTNDYGVDILARKENEVIAIKTKRYSNAVGIQAIQAVSAGISHYQATKGMVITSALDFTPQAKKLADSCNIILWTLKDLQEIVDQIEVQTDPE